MEPRRFRIGFSRGGAGASGTQGAGAGAVAWSTAWHFSETSAACLRAAATADSDSRRSSEDARRKGGAPMAATLARRRFGAWPTADGRRAGRLGSKSRAPSDARRLASDFLGIVFALCAYFRVFIVSSTLDILGDTQARPPILLSLQSRPG